MRYVVLAALATLPGLACLPAGAEDLARSPAAPAAAAATAAAAPASEASQATVRCHRETHVGTMMPVWVCGPEPSEAERQRMLDTIRNETRPTGGPTR